MASRRVPKKRSARTATDNSDKRKPMGARAAEVERGARGRTGTETTPVHIRGPVHADGTADAAFIRSRLGSKLGRFARRIDRLDVAASSKPPAGRGAGVEIVLTARIANQRPVVATSRGDTAREAFLAALRAAERTLRRAVERRRATTRAVRG